MDVFRPGAVILQCGADSLAADRLGCFMLTISGVTHYLDLGTSSVLKQQMQLFTKPHVHVAPLVPLHYVTSTDQFKLYLSTALA